MKLKGEEIIMKWFWQVVWVLGAILSLVISVVAFYNHNLESGTVLLMITALFGLVYWDWGD